jgi:hypothetical protein
MVFVEPGTAALPVQRLLGEVSGRQDPAFRSLVLGTVGIGDDA